MSAIGPIPFKPASAGEYAAIKRMDPHGSRSTPLPAEYVTWARCTCRRSQPHRDSTLGVRCLKCAHWIDWQSVPADSTSPPTVRIYVSKTRVRRLSGRDSDDMNPTIRRMRTAAMKDLDVAVEQLREIAGSGQVTIDRDDDELVVTALDPSMDFRGFVDDLLDAAYGADWHERLTVEPVPA